MKKIIFLVAISAFPLIGHSQIEVNTEVLDENNVGITLSDGGIFLAKPHETMYGGPTLEMTSAGCEYPKGSGNTIMNGLSFWFGGVDQFDEPRISAPTSLAYEDQFSGPLSQGNLDQAYYWNSFFNTVSREEIDFHITNYQNPNYVMPESIASWPAHGDVSEGIDYYLAPYVSVSGENYYNPYMGDYPCIQGDRATYMIMNDKVAPISCGGPRNHEHLGIEIHYMFYQYSSIPELANTTFCKVRVINRSASNFTDFSSAVFMNAGVGSSIDDFMATDVKRNLMYTFNAEEVDEQYGTKPPAVGIVSLNNTIDRSRVFGDYSNYGYHFPSFPPEFWEVMQGNLLTGENFPKRFGFPGDPVMGEGDIQMLGEQASSMIYSFDIGQFDSGEEHTFDFAIVVGQGETNMGSVQRLRESVDFVQDFYNQEEGACVEAIVGIPATIDPQVQPAEETSTMIYPNPSFGEFTIEVEEEWVGADLTVFTGAGLMLYSLKNLSATQNTISLTNGPGVYLVNLEKDGVSTIVKAVVE